MFISLNYFYLKYISQKMIIRLFVLVLETWFIWYNFRTITFFSVSSNHQVKSEVKSWMKFLLFLLVWLGDKSHKNDITTGQPNREQNRNFSIFGLYVWTADQQGEHAIYATRMVNFLVILMTVLSKQWSVRRDVDEILRNCLNWEFTIRWAIIMTSITRKKEEKMGQCNEWMKPSSSFQIIPSSS